MIEFLFILSKKMISGEEYSASDCCGNGCANCVLDLKPKHTDKFLRTGKRNVISNYSKFKLLSKVARHSDVYELHFKSCMESSADYILNIPSGHHLMLRTSLSLPESKSGSKNDNLLRPYSPFWVDAINMEFKILVNLRPGGLMSKYLENLIVDDEAEFRGPIGTYMHHPNNDKPRNIYLITQGVAVAPTLPIIEEILSNEDDISMILHMACFRDLPHVYFHDRLREYNSFWNYSCHIFLAHQNCGHTECMSSGCTEKCENFRNSWQYKQVVHTHKLNVFDFEEICRTNTKMEKVFIIAGSREFQSSVAEMMQKLEIAVKEENIFHL